MLHASLANLGPQADPQTRRAAVVRDLGRIRASATDDLQRLFGDGHLTTRALIRALSDLTDTVVTVAFGIAPHLDPDATGAISGPPKSDTRPTTASGTIAVLAVGGYGRAEMAPHSDVDLLFLLPERTSARTRKLIEAVLYILWDLKLKVGHASRTTAECLTQAREDMTVRTALLEHRFIAGNTHLAGGLRGQLTRALFASTSAEFIEAKLAERASRHARQGGQRYVLEPNIKEGKGGLRDLQTLYWIGKYLHGVESAADLVGEGLFTPEEYDVFNRAETFLWTIRCHLHIIAGRAADQLTFDLQVEVAGRMGYADSAGRRAVERFMQDYFRHATQVGELTRIFLTALEARHVKSAPGFLRLFRRKPRVGILYKLVHNRLAVANPEAFLSDPLNLLRIFEEGLRTGVLLHPDAMRLITANLHLIDEGLQTDPRAARIFLDLLLKHGNPERALRRMNELGVLGAFIPEFEPIVAMMQFNVYHHYTVDEHTIQCLSILAQIERGELDEELPIASRILADGLNREVLYVALLLHDIGKGRPEDHAVVGAQLARKIAPRLGLGPEDCETVEWLVRLHLLMSDTAQKRDISDPRTVRNFARAVKSRKRLDLLTVLTVCDIRGVGPGTWNNWKAMLLRKLYSNTAEALETGLEASSRAQAETEAQGALRTSLTDWATPEIDAEVARHYGPYWQGLSSTTHAVFARLLHGLGSDDIRIDLHPDPDHDATRACFALADHPGIFSRLSGALALSGANVVDARTYTSKDGYATAVFWIQDADGHPYDQAHVGRLRRTIERTLKGEVVTRDALKDRDKVKKRDREFRFPTTITFDNEGSDIYTIIEVDARDRPGLLYDLTRCLANANIYIASAMIATYGAQVVDTFYVKDMFGLKLHSRSRQETLDKRLREAISEGAARARG